MSTLQQFSLFGRKYELTVALPGTNGAELITLASSDFGTSGNESLRVTFDVYTPAFQAYWYADICVYNLDQGLTQKIISAAAPPQPTGSVSQQAITQGVIVTLSAGYQNGAYGVIWKGVLFQPLWEREGTVDFKLTLHCVTALDKYSRNFISGQFAAGLNQTQLLNAIIAQTASTPAPIKAASANSLSKNLSTQVFARGITVFGNPKKYVDQIAQSNNMQWWESNGGLNIGSPVEDVAVTAADPLVFTPPPLPGVNSSAPVIPAKNQGIIVGTPQQTQAGVSFRALLDPRIRAEKPLQKVKLDYTQLILQKKQLGQLPGILDQNGTYIVGGVQFRGDTRGSEWYVEVTGYTVIGNSLAMFIGQSAATSGAMNQ